MAAASPQQQPCLEWQLVADDQFSGLLFVGLVLTSFALITFFFIECVTKAFRA